MADDQIRALRERIDELDARILKLMNERAQCAHDIGALKGDAAVYRPEREAQVLSRLNALNAGPLPAASVLHVFTEIISACRALERTMSVAYLGPRGTYSEDAVARQFGAQAKAEPCASISEVFKRVESGATGYGVVPVENSTEGGIGMTLDLLLASTAKVCGEVNLPIHHCLLAKSKSLNDVHVVYAHAQALAQCNEWLSRNLPNAQRVALASNAEGAQRAAAEASSAAIASRSAASLYSLDVLMENIEDLANNTTRFLVIGTQEVGRSGNDKTSLVLSAPHRAGALYELLGPLARNGVSMTRFESRPSHQGLWEYMFFVDVLGHKDDDRVAVALRELAANAAFMKILGSYPVAVA